MKTKKLSAMCNPQACRIAAKNEKILKQFKNISSKKNKKAEGGPFSLAISNIAE